MSKMVNWAEKISELKAIEMLASGPRAFLSACNVVEADGPACVIPGRLRG
jgi:hypothetical protein